MEYLLQVLIFIVVLTFLEVGYLAISGSRISEKAKVRSRLKALSVMAENEEHADILKKNRLSEIPWLHFFLNRFAVMEKMTLFVEQAGSQRTPGLYLLLSLTLAVIGLLVGGPFHSSFFPLVPSLFIIVPCAAALAILPFMYLMYKRKKRFGQFEEQLPEALDFIARSLKAGHAFSSGLKLASTEMAPPLSEEFEKTVNEINFGLSTQDALANMAQRIPLSDLGFFVISVNLQRETGGNLAEILGNLSHLIRERFKLNGQVRVLSSQAKLSAYILVAMPFVTAFVVHLINPTYFDPMLSHPAGKYIIAAGVCWMIIGTFVMKKMVTIKV